jgi:hypothetical protein
MDKLTAEPGRLSAIIYLIRHAEKPNRRPSDYGSGAPEQILPAQPDLGQHGVRGCSASMRGGRRPGPAPERAIESRDVGVTQA